MSFRLPRFVCVCLLLIPLVAQAGEQQDTRTRLQQIKQRIEQTSQSLQARQQQELSLLRDLVAINTSLQEIDRRIKQLQQEQEQAERKMQGLQSEIDQGQRDLRSAELKLKKRLIALYKDNNTGLLKVLFSSDTPMELSQQYTYLSRILAHDKVLMADYRQVLEQQQERLADLQLLKNQQEKRLANENSERQDARSARQLQAQVLSKVRNDKSQLHAELQQLKEKASRLEDLVRQLKTSRGGGSGPFATLQGKLPWPLKGALLVGFGTQKNSGFGTLYESHGIGISAAAGTKVKAVAQGKVVFASWFKGYGNLLIVSHPGGYHTLYAQMDKLLKQVGDEVGQGEDLAVAGLPGEEGIYFEIRGNGAPLNPLAWLTPRKY